MKKNTTHPPRAAIGAPLHCAYHFFAVGIILPTHLFCIDTSSFFGSQISFATYVLFFWALWSTYSYVYSLCPLPTPTNLFCTSRSSGSHLTSRPTYCWVCASVAVTRLKAGSKPKPVTCCSQVKPRRILGKSRLICMESLTVVLMNLW